MINHNDFFNPIERKVKVSVDVKKIQEPLDLNTVELEERLKDMFRDFEAYLLKDAIRLKSRSLPDLGNKDLARKYREVMRVDFE